MAWSFQDLVLLIGDVSDDTATKKVSIHLVIGAQSNASQYP